MKRAIIILCVLAQTVIIAMANMVVISYIVGAYADAIGYYGLLNIPMFLIVSTIVCATLVVFLGELRKNFLKLED